MAAATVAGELDLKVQALTDSALGYLDAGFANVDDFLHVSSSSSGAQHVLCSLAGPSKAIVIVLKCVARGGRGRVGRARVDQLSGARGPAPVPQAARQRAHRVPALEFVHAQRSRTSRQ
jgi:hypothetical protein